MVYQYSLQGIDALSSESCLLFPLYVSEITLPSHLPLKNRQRRETPFNLAYDANVVHISSCAIMSFAIKCHIRVPASVQDRSRHVCTTRVYTIYI